VGWTSAEAWLRGVAERETADLALMTRYREAVKPPHGEQGMVRRRRKQERPSAEAEDVSTGGRT